MNNDLSLEFSPCSESFANEPAVQDCSISSQSGLTRYARVVRTKIRKDMQLEIQKYQGRIYYYDEVDKQIYPANWVHSLQVLCSK